MKKKNNQFSISDDEIKIAKNIVEKKVKYLRNETPNIIFPHDKLAELEINKFFYNSKTVDRVMVVLRANGCEHYKKNGGCSMCSHFNGVDRNNNISTDDYKKQWDSVIDGSAVELKEIHFNINDYPIVCVYNLGSLLNSDEISFEAVRYIFKSLNKYSGVKKVIIESRAEYITEESIRNIHDVYDKGIVEVGIGVESTNNVIRNICHHKGLDDLSELKRAIDILHNYGFKALAYINLKPILLTEQEAIDDAINTAIDCIELGFDAISIEPTSLQDYSLANQLYLMGEYRVPWLWSIRDVIQGIYDNANIELFDIRIGGYFDEEVLSGSQGVGFDNKNELFPHMTSLNCPKCSKKFIDCIKRFNMTYDINDLYAVEKCNVCYKLWNDVKKINDSRNILDRIYDIFGKEK